MYDEKMTVFVRDFPDDVWRRFKALCQIEGKKHKDLLAEILLDATKHLPEAKSK